MASNAEDVDSALRVSFMSGDEVTVQAGSQDTVADVKQKILAVKPAPPGRCLKLFRDAEDLKDAELVAALAGCTLNAVFSGHELSYRALASSDNPEMLLLMPGDEAYKEDLAEKSANLDPSRWVPAPEEHPTCCNLAMLSAGATATSSSSIWGTNPSAIEKLHNVLRLGAKHGDPRFLGGDNSFIFKERDGNQTLTVDLGRPAVLVRVGTMCYGDRWLNQLEIATSVQKEEPQEWHIWGERRSGMQSGGEFHFDSTPIKARFIRFRCSSGHYHGAGARLGPVFAYGWAECDAPEAVP